MVRRRVLAVSDFGTVAGGPERLLEVNQATRCARGAKTMPMFVISRSQNRKARNVSSRRDPSVATSCTRPRTEFHGKRSKSTARGVRCCHASGSHSSNHGCIRVLAGHFDQSPPNFRCIGHRCWRYLLSIVAPQAVTGHRGALATNSNRAGAVPASSRDSGCRGTARIAPRRDPWNRAAGGALRPVNSSAAAAALHRHGLC